MHEVLSILRIRKAVQSILSGLLVVTSALVVVMVIIALW
jgi:hypothetical protein